MLKFNNKLWCISSNRPCAILKSQGFLSARPAAGGAETLTWEDTLYIDYLILQVETGWDRYIHVRIYRDLHGNASVSSVQLNKSADDVIGYF